MAKIEKITTAEISATITETFANEVAAAEGKGAINTEVEVLEIKTDRINWRKVKDEQSTS